MKTKQEKPTMCQCVSNCAITKNGITLCGYCLKEKPTTAGKDIGRWHINPEGNCPDGCPGCALQGKSKPKPQIIVPPQIGREWEKEFDRLFVKHANNPPSYILGYAHPRQNDKPIKEFIASLLLSEHRRWEAELRKRIQKLLDDEVKLQSSFKGQESAIIYARSLIGDVLSLLKENA